MKIFNTKICALLLTVFLSVNSALAIDQGTLQVTSITPTQTLATPDGDFENGWQWIFNVTVPTNEKVVRVKFANWTSGTTTITTTGNVRFYSPQSTNSNSTTTAKILSSANVYSDTISLSSSLDLSPSTIGRQIQIVVDVKVPVGTTGGSYASSYGISSDIDPSQATGIVQYTIDPTYEIISVNGNQTNQIIGQVLVTAQNEDVKLNTLTLDPKFSDPNINPTFSGLTNLKLFFNGTQIGSTTSWDLDPEDRPIIFNFDSDVILQVGQQKTITVRSDLNFISSLTVSTGTLNTVIGGLTSNAQGVTTNRLISVFAVPFNLATTTLTNHSALSDVTLSNTVGFATSTKSPNQSQVKIGSFTLTTGNSEPITLTSIRVDLSGSAQTSNQITNLTVKDGSNTIGTSIGNPSTSNNFSADITIGNNSTKVLDVYADLGSASAGTNITPSLGVSIRGNASNITNTLPVILGLQTIIDVATIINSGITFNAGSSPSAQLIVGNQSNRQLGVFNFKTSNNVGGAVLRDLTFAVASGTISTITVNGKTASVIGGSATIFDSGIVVPSSSSGVDVPVNASISCVGISNGCPFNSPVLSQATITALTYNDGNSVQTLFGINKETNKFYIVGSKPVVTQASSITSGLGSGFENKIGEVIVSADASGNIKLNQIAFDITASGISSPTISSPRIADGNTTIVGSSCIGSGSLPETTVCTFSGGYSIVAGTTKTFSLYATVTGTLGSAGQSSISSTVSGKSLQFIWDDIIGGGTNLNGEFIYNFPTNSYTKIN